jgi:hypothetical protein
MYLHNLEKNHGSVRDFCERQGTAEPLATINPFVLRPATWIASAQISVIRALDFASNTSFLIDTWFIQGSAFDSGSAGGARNFSNLIYMLPH